MNGLRNSNIPELERAHFKFFLKKLLKVCERFQNKHPFNRVIIFDA